MTYIFAEDKKISGKWIQKIWRMDSTYITEYGYNEPVSQPTSQPVSLSVLGRQTDFSQPPSQSVRLSLTDRPTFINDLFRFSRYKNIRRMDSTYITECGYKGSVSQPTSQPVSVSVCP